MIDRDLRWNEHQRLHMVIRKLRFSMASSNLSTLKTCGVAASPPTRSVGASQRRLLNRPPFPLQCKMRNPDKGSGPFSARVSGQLGSCASTILCANCIDTWGKNQRSHQAFEMTPLFLLVSCSSLLRLLTLKLEDPPPLAGFAF